MISFPNAKINLGLNVVEKRTDGYHDLETVFYPIQLRDVLEIMKSDRFEFKSTGLIIDGNSYDNLVVKAYWLLQEKFDLAPIKIHLHKVIPFGAGLGGGSSDAAFMLKMLNEMFNLGLTVSELEKYAGQLGADCPFFVQNKPVYATGVGNQFSPLELSLHKYSIVVVKPPFSVSTAEAYGNIVPKASGFSLEGLNSLKIEEWKNMLRNDFEEPVFKIYPEIAEIKTKLYESGAIYASMSGSGSAVFGLFRHLPMNFESLFPETYFIYR